MDSSFQLKYLNKFFFPGFERIPLSRKSPISGFEEKAHKYNVLFIEIINLKNDLLFKPMFINFICLNQTLFIHQIIFRKNGISSAYTNSALHPSLAFQEEKSVFQN